MLQGVGSVNDFNYVDSVEFTQGDEIDVYFQLIDASKDKAIQQFKPAGRRYMPAADSELTVTLDNIDDDVKVTRAASQPFEGDPSIWKVSLTADDVIRGTVNLILVLDEDGVVKRGRLEAALAIASQDLV